MNLFEISAAIEDVCRRIGEAGDAESPELIAELERLFESREQKHVGYVHVIKNTHATLTGLRAEITLFKNRVRALMQLEARLKSALQVDLKRHGETSVLAGNYRIARQTGQKRVVVNVPNETLPAEYQHVRTAADRVGLKHALEQGEQIEGVELQDTEHIRIRAK